MGGALGKQSEGQAAGPGGEAGRILGGMPEPGLPTIAKVVLSGAPGVGKTAFCTRFADDTFSAQFVATIGIDFKIRSLTLPEPEPEPEELTTSQGGDEEPAPDEDAVPLWLAALWRSRVDFGDGRTYKFQMWDPAGPERYRALTTAYYRGATGVAVLFRADDAETWTQAVRLVEDANRHQVDSIPVCLVCTACDLIPSADELLGGPGEPANMHDDGRAGKLPVDWNAVGGFMDEYNAVAGHYRIPLVFVSSKLGINVRVVSALLLGLKGGWDVPEEYFDTNMASRLSNKLTKSALKR